MEYVHTFKHDLTPFYLLRTLLDEDCSLMKLGLSLARVLQYTICNVHIMQSATCVLYCKCMSSLVGVKKVLQLKLKLYILVGLVPHMQLICKVEEYTV